MKDKDFLDLRELLDEIFAGAEDFFKTVKDEFDDCCSDGPWNGKGPWGGRGPWSGEGPWKGRGSWAGGPFRWSDQRDYYSSYSYPPTNVYMTADKSMVLEFALAGFREEDLELEFRGDYLMFSAKIEAGGPEDDKVHYFKRRLKFRPIEEQRYYVPEDKFDRGNVKAVFKNSILTVTVPPRDGVKPAESVRVNISGEGPKRKVKPDDNGTA